MATDSNENIAQPLTLEQRLSHIEQMVELFGKHTDIHMRSTTDMQKQSIYLTEQLAELQKVVQLQGQTIATLLSALPPIPGADQPSESGS